MAKKQITPAASETRFSLTPTVETPLTDTPAGDRGLTRHSRTMLTNAERTTFVATYSMMITTLKTAVDAASTLILALDPDAATEGDMQAALTAYEAITKPSTTTTLSALVTKLKA